jgi:D-sedoheptulose 7-phosphate isomerase
VTTTAFMKNYVTASSQALAKIPLDDLESVVQVLVEAYERRARVFIAGNGGSASLASHLACDLEKTASGPQPRLAKQRLRATSLSDNVATLTAWANDEGYRVVFSEQLRAQAEAQDVLIVISASGNSPNIVAALEAAAELGMHTIAMVGFDGGLAMRLADQHLHVANDDYGIVEGVHGVLTHAITACLVKALGIRREAQAAQEEAAEVAPKIGKVIKL